MDTRIRNHFKRTDPILYAAARGVGKLEKIEPKDSREYFNELCRKIVGQQVSGKAAESIFGRFLALFPARRLARFLVRNALKKNTADALGSISRLPSSRRAWTRF